MKTPTTPASRNDGIPVAPDKPRVQPVDVLQAKAVATVLALLLVAVPVVNLAGQLTLSSSPLFLTSTVPANIFFLTDDSGSMAWEFVYNVGTGYEDNSGTPEGESTIDLTPNTATERRFMCPGYNVLAFNVSTTYNVWQGVDDAGVIYDNAWLYNGGTDASPNYNVRKDPYISNTSSTYRTDLTASGIMAYWPWTDSDGDGKYDAGECGDTSSDDNSGGVAFSSLTDAQKKNFANWYTYHRKRQYVAKYAIGKVIAQAGSEVNMGHGTLHNNGGTSNIKIANMNSSVSSGAKKAILDALYKVQASGSTPLRSKLYQVGRYYECKSGNIFGLDEGSSLCPIATNASGGYCQQNFTVLMTDGHWNSDEPDLPGTGNVDANGNSPDSAGNTIYDGGAYADTYSDTLADVAMHFYERDLAPNLSNQVPVTAGVDNASHQHMVTYTVAFGLGGTLSAGPTNTTDAFAWPDPINNSGAERIDDLRHAAFNGRGEFLSARNPDDLTTALEDAISSIGDRTGAAASVAVNSRSLSTTTRLYQARFTSGEWSGDLRALSVNASGDVDTQVWSAKNRLISQNWDTGREIIARDGGTGVAFRWASLTATTQSLLGEDPTTTATDYDGQGAARLEYVRGNSTHEGTGNNYRTRTDSFKLGDIVNSSPIFVGAPVSLPDLETTAHSTFRSAYVSRREMVYVGANDGMLHGFDAATGDEKIAYIPSMVLANLKNLTNPSYSHQYFVDASPAAGDAYGTFTNVSGVCSSGCWRTLLVGGLGGGGKGIYALDITDPDGEVSTSGISTAQLAFDEDNASRIALWEYTATSDNDMGYVYGQPTITKVRNGANNYSWAVIFGNGYNSTSENAVLYIVNAVTGALIRKIVLNPDYDATWNATGVTPYINGNGLSMPAVVDTNGDYIADYVYAGDLRGNMWKVDLTDNNVNNWDSAYKQGSDARPLYKAVDASGNEQPITVQPEVGNHPDGENGYMVYFGTGRYITSGDNSASTSPVHTFYGIWDQPYNSSDATATAGPVSRSELAYQTISTATVSSTTVRQVTNSSIVWGTDATESCAYDSGTDTFSGCLGWRVDLLTASSGTAGEKSVSNPVLLGGTVSRIIFTTLIPQTDICTAGGSSWLMELNPTNGGRLSEQVFDINGDGTIDSSDMIDGTPPIPVAGINPGIGIMPEPTILRDTANKTDLKTESGSTGAIQTIKNYVSGTQSGRRSWRQLK